MEIKIATIEDAEIITSIVENTITEIYPKYLSGKYRIFPKPTLKRKHNKRY